MVDVFSRGIVVPGGLENASDATLFKVAKQTGQNANEIKKIDGELRKLRAEARKASAEARRATGATVGTVAGGAPAGSRYRVRGSGAGVSAGPVALRGGRIAINARSVRMGTGAFIGMGVLGAVGGALKQWRDGQDIREKYGTGELLGRLGREQLRGVFKDGAEGVATALSEIVGASGGNRAAYLRRFGDMFKRDSNQLAKLLFPGLWLMEETEAEFRERKDREAKAVQDSLNIADAILNAELDAIKQYRPQNIRFRTSQDMEAMRRRISDMDGAAIRADAKAASDEIRRRAGILCED